MIMVEILVTNISLRFSSTSPISALQWIQEDLRTIR